MGKKEQLKGSKIYVSHDLSREDSNIHCKFREIARQEREQGARKIRINGNWIKWEQGRENNGFFYKEDLKETSK